MSSTTTESSSTYIYRKPIRRLILAGILAASSIFGFLWTKTQQTPYLSDIACANGLDNEIVLPVGQGQTILQAVYHSSRFDTSGKPFTVVFLGKHPDSLNDDAQEGRNPKSPFPAPILTEASRIEDFVAVYGEASNQVQQWYGGGTTYRSDLVGDSFRVNFSPKFQNRIQEWIVNLFTGKPILNAQLEYGFGTEDFDLGVRAVGSFCTSTFDPEQASGN